MVAVKREKSCLILKLKETTFMQRMIYIEVTVARKGEKHCIQETILLAYFRGCYSGFFNRNAARKKIGRRNREAGI